MPDRTARPDAGHTVKRDKRGLKTWWAAPTAVLVALGTPSLTASASADDTDDAFLAALQQHGIVFANRDATITAGHSVCAGLDLGKSPTLVILTVRKNTNLSAHTAAYFFGAAVMSYCPQYTKEVDDSAP